MARSPSVSLCPTHLRPRPHRPSSDAAWCHWLFGPRAKSAFLSWLIGLLWLRSLSWRGRRMKRENGIIVVGGRLADRSREMGFSCRFKVPDALPGSIMVPYRGLRWFQRSNCEDKTQDGNQQGSTHRNSRRVHTCSHKYTCLLTQLPTKSGNYVVLYAGDFQRRL